MEDGQMQPFSKPSPADRPRRHFEPKPREPNPPSFEIPEPAYAEKERFVKAYWDRIIEEVERFIQEDGVAFFKVILAKAGTLNVIRPGPHPVAKREGQLVRNIMMRTSCRHWREEDYLKYWEQIIIDAIELHEKKKIEREQSRLAAIAREEEIRKRGPRLARRD